MTNKILIFALAFIASIFLASAVSAYDVKYTINMDQTSYDYELYHCTSSSCAAVDSLVLSGNTGLSNSVTLSYSTTGTQYHAFYLYETGYRYKQGIITTNSKYTSSVSSTFNKKQNCNASINVVSAPAILNAGDTLQVNATIQSAFQSTTPGSGLPLYEPTTHSAFMESDVRTTITLSNSSGTIASANQVQSIWLSHQANFLPSITNVPAGNYTLTIRTDCIDNQCNLTNAVPMTQVRTITVNSAPNHVPVITTSPVTTGTIGVLYRYDVNATDADGNTLTYSLATSPLGMTINSATGMISWTPSVVGSFSVNVSVSDGMAGASQSYTLAVSAVPNNAPAITSTPITTAVANKTYSYDVNALDIDGDTLVYSLTTYPLNMTINSATGLITWIPTELGSYFVRINVSDGRASTTQDYTLVVTNQTQNNTAPTIQITSPADNSKFAKDDVILFTATVTDAEESGLQAVWTSSLDGSLGTGNSISKILSVGMHIITARVTDSGGLSTTESIILTVKDGSGGGDDNTDNSNYLGEYINVDGLLIKNQNILYDNSKLRFGRAIEQSEGLNPILAMLMLLITLVLLVILLVLLFRKK